MNWKRYYNIFLGVFIVMALFNLVSMFLAIQYNPNYKMKGHHDYPYSCYLLFAFFGFFWIISLFGLFQLKYYLMGKERLMLITFIFGGLITYSTFLIFINYPFDSVEKKRQTADLFSLIFPSAIILTMSRTNYAQKIHNYSKQENRRKLNEKLGI